MTTWTPTLGATVDGAATRFRVWAPAAGRVEVCLETPGHSSVHAMGSAGGFHTAVVEGVGAGDLYRFRIDGRGPFPDPASRYQPLGVHGPSAVVDWRAFRWTDAGWAGRPLEDTILYEFHVGTFTPEGTFVGAGRRLHALASLGVTAIELMPIADFPGRWNWGYDGVAMFAPARCYGAPDDLRGLVDDAHRLGMAVHLDVVYNHLGPDGAYQSAFSPFYTGSHDSPWGPAVRFDGPGSPPVRDYVIENALRWVHEYHLDGLRLDATHAIRDESYPHVLAQLADDVRRSLEGSGRRALVIAEDHRNLAHIVRPASGGGWALDGVWSDDFHHQLRRGLAGDADGYYADFEGTPADIAATARRGWFYCGQHSWYFSGPRGTDPAGIELPRFVFFLQNHDQVGNRAFGERLHHQVDLAAWRAASVLLLVLPETPLLFMGQEWAATTPFAFFADHHAELGRAVTEGRRREFSRFAAFSNPLARERIPDPQAEQTFLASCLDWRERDREPHASVLRLYRSLITLRRTSGAMGTGSGHRFDVTALDADCLLVQRAAPGAALRVIVRLRGAGRVALRVVSPPGLPAGWRWKQVLTTEDPAFAADPRPVRISADIGVAEFERPGAVILAGEPPLAVGGS